MKKPSIVFAHGLWADGSCFSKLIVPLQAEGYECIAAQYGLNSTAEDVALTKATMGRVSGPIILVGHSYGGPVITGGGMNRHTPRRPASRGPRSAPTCDPSQDGSGWGRGSVVGKFACWVWDVSSAS